MPLPGMDGAQQQTKQVLLIFSIPHSLPTQYTLLPSDFHPNTNKASSLTSCSICVLKGQTKNPERGYCSLIYGQVPKLLRHWIGMCPACPVQFFFFFFFLGGEVEVDKYVWHLRNIMGL